MRRARKIGKVAFRIENVDDVEKIRRMVRYLLIIIDVLIRLDLRTV